MKSSNWTTVLGIVTVGLWVSYLPNLFPIPLKPHAGIQHLSAEARAMSAWVKAEAGMTHVDPETLEKKLHHEYRVHWMLSTLFVVGGIVSGALILLRHDAGRIAAIVFALLILGNWFFGASHIGDRPRLLFTVLIKKHPFMAVQDVLTLVLCLLMLFHFTRREVITEFKTRR